MGSVAKRTGSDSKTDVPAKRLKLDIENAAPTTILDLDEDCLAELFLYLKQEDLVNVRLTNSWFRCASERVFTRKYAKSQTIVSMVRDNRYDADVVEASVRLMQAFGPLITKLLVKFKLENVGKLLESIDEYCGESVVELELCHFGVSVYQQHLYESGLVKMKEFLDGGLHGRFPNLHHLKVEYRNKKKLCPYLKSLARPIPSLKSFSIAGAFFALEDIGEFIGVNGQLESLAIIGEPNETSTSRSLSITSEFMNYVDAALPQLQRVQIGRVSMKQSPYGRHPTIAFQNLKTLTIGDSVLFRFSDNDACLFAGKNIKEIRSYVSMNYISSFASEISRFPKLKRLVVNFLISDHSPNKENRRLAEQLRIIVSNRNRLMKIVIQLYHWNGDRSTVAHVDPPYLDSIKSVFDTAQWSLNEDANGLAFSIRLQN